MKNNTKKLEIENDDKSMTLSELDFLGETIDELVDLNYKVSKHSATVNEIEEIEQLKLKINNICDISSYQTITEGNQFTYLREVYHCYDDKLDLYSTTNELF